MPETNTTILIPDISGFTEFMTNTELSHGSHVINMLIQAMLKAVDDEYEISEIEGDAIVLIKKGPAPALKEIQDSCLRIFNAFHYQRKWMQMHAICPCAACLCAEKLTLKFIVHHGPLTEIKVGRFVKQSGAEMIVAHRLLKNSIGKNEYLLITEKLLQQTHDSKEKFEMEWNSSSDEYPSIGKIDYRFALLNEERNKVTGPPMPDSNYRTDDTPYMEIPVAANFRDVYMVLMNIPGRAQWAPGLQEVEQQIPDVFVGTIHHCTFDDLKTIISPMRMRFTDEGIIYAESCRIDELDLSMVHEYIFKKDGDLKCIFGCRSLNMNDTPVPDEINTSITNKMKAMAESLKDYCEKMEKSFFEPSFQNTAVK